MRIKPYCWLFHFPLPISTSEKILVYSNNDTLSFKDVKANLLFKEKFDLEVRSDNKAEGQSQRDVNPVNFVNIAGN